MQYKEAMLIVAITTLTAKHIDEVEDLPDRYFRTKKGSLRLDPKYLMEWTKCSLDDLILLVNNNPNVFDISVNQQGILTGIAAPIGLVGSFMTRHPYDQRKQRMMGMKNNQEPVSTRTDIDSDASTDEQLQ